MTDDLRICALISVETKYGQFNDAIYYPYDSPPTQEQIDADKQARVDAWIYFIENAPEIPPEEGN